MIFESEPKENTSEKGMITQEIIDFIHNKHCIDCKSKVCKLCFIYDISKKLERILEKT